MPRRKCDAIDRLIGKNIRAHRERLGLSQTQLGDVIGVSFQQIQKFEKGLNRIAASQLFKISQALRVQPQRFFESARARIPSSGARAFRR